MAGAFVLFLFMLMLFALGFWAGERYAEQYLEDKTFEIMALFKIAALENQRLRRELARTRRAR